MPAPDDEIAALDARALELERAIEERQRRIASMLGLPGARLRTLAERLRLEVTVSLPALDIARARVELLRALHEELGMLGAVRTERGTMEWRPLHRQLGGRFALEVDLDAGAQGATLRLRDSFHAGVSATEAVAAITLAQLPGLALVFSLLAWASLPVVAFTGLLLSCVVLGYVPSIMWMRRRARPALERFAERLAARLPRQGTVRARVADEAGASEVEAVAGDVLGRKVVRGVP